MVLRVDIYVTFNAGTVTSIEGLHLSDAKWVSLWSRVQAEPIEKAMIFSPQLNVSFIFTYMGNVQSVRVVWYSSMWTLWKYCNQEYIRSNSTISSTDISSTNTSSSWRRSSTNSNINSSSSSSNSWSCSSMLFYNITLILTYFV